MTIHLIVYQSRSGAGPAVNSVAIASPSGYWLVKLLHHRTDCRYGSAQRSRTHARRRRRFGKGSTDQILEFCSQQKRPYVVSDRYSTELHAAQTETSATSIAPEEAAPGTEIPTSPDLQAPQAPGNELSENGSTAAQATSAPNSYYWQPGPYGSQPVYASGWYYQDIQHHTQGPFTKQQLQIWRQHLPWICWCGSLTRTAAAVTVLNWLRCWETAGC